MKDPEEFTVDTFLEELREKREKIEQAKEVQRLYMLGMGYGEAMCRVLGLKPIDAQLENEVDDYHRNHYWRQKGDL